MALKRIKGESAREFEARSKGGTLDYRTGQISKPIQPISSFTASKTPVSRLMQAQKSQPIKAYSQPSYDTVTQEKGAIGPAQPWSIYEKNQKEAQRKFNDQEATRYKQEAQKAQEAAKPLNVLKGLVAPNYGFDTSPYRKESHWDAKAGKIVTTGKDTSFKDKAKAVARTTGEIANLIPTAGGFLAKQASRLGSQSYQEKVSRGVESFQKKASDILTPKTASEAAAQQVTTAVSNFIPGMGVLGKTGVLKAGVGRLVNRAAAKGVESTGINRIISEGAKGAFNPTNIARAESTLRSADDIARNNVPNLPENAPRRTVEAPRATREIQPTIKDVPEVRKRPVPTTREELPKANTNTSDQLFEETDGSGRSKVYANVDDGSSTLKKTEVGEFDESGNFIERNAEDGRPISEVLDESSKNLREGKRGVTRLEAPSGSVPIGALKGKGKLGGRLGQAFKTSQAKSQATRLAEQLKQGKITPEEYQKAIDNLDFNSPTVGETVPNGARLNAPESPLLQEAGKTSSWSELQKTNPDLFNTGVLRRSHSPMGAKEPIPKDVQYSKDIFSGKIPVPKDVVAKTLGQIKKVPKRGLLNRSLPGFIKNPFVKERGFISTAKESGNLPPQVKNFVEGDYTRMSQSDMVIKARNLAKDFPDIAERLARSTKDTPVHRAITMEVIKKYSESGNHDVAIDLIEQLAKRGTSSGQANSLFAAFNKLTPEGVGRFAQRQVDIANEMFPNANLKLNGKQYADFYKKAKELQGLPDGYDKQFKTAILLRDIKDIFPASVASKIGMFQTVGQLLNPKTFVRNFGGNVLFGMGLENFTQVVRTPVDTLVSLFTGKRTTGLPNLVTQGKSFKKGLLQGAREAKEGIMIGPNTQFDLPQTRIFRGKVMGSLEKAMGMSLRAPDKAAYTAAFDDSIRSQMKANKAQTATAEMLEVAHYDGLYRTFQDDNVVSRFFVGMKKTLNKIGLPGADGTRFGLGDLVLKYPKTPGSLISKGIDYTPAGFIKTVFQAGKPLFGKPFEQKAFVDSFSRALVGSTGLVGTGALFYNLGIITGSPEKDTDVRATQKTTGQGGYQINVSGLKRFILSGLSKDAAQKKDGDYLVSYDWLQPMAAPVSLGAKLASGDATGLSGTLAESVTGGVDTLQEQSLVTGLKRLFGYGDIKGGIEETIKGSLASFVPTLSNQIRQITDNTGRSTYDPSIAKETLNRAALKVPGLASTLPEASDVLGKTKETYQEGSNNFFNVFLNPSFVSKIKESPEAKMVLDLFENTQEVSQMPRVTGKKIGDVTLSAEQYVEFQKVSGEATKAAFSTLAKSSEFNKLGDYDKVKRLASVLTDVGKMAKAQVLGGGSAESSKSLEEIKQKQDSRDAYDKIQELKKSNPDQAQKAVDDMSDEDYTKYTKVRASERAKSSGDFHDLLSTNPSKAVEYVRSQSEEEQQRLVDNMTDEQYALYDANK